MITALIILGAVLLILLALLFLPVSVHLKFKDDFDLKIKFSGIKVFEMEPKEKEQKNSEADTVSDQKAEDNVSEKGKSFFETLKKKYGFSGAVREILRFAGEVLTHIKSLLRHIKIRRVVLNITVASGDAAQTAIEYGAVCSAAYPVLAALDSCVGVGFKAINIKSDFDSAKPDFDFGLIVRLQIFFLVIAAFKIYSEYKKFIVRNELQ